MSSVFNKKVDYFYNVPNSDLLNRKLKKSKTAKIAKQFIQVANDKLYQRRLDKLRTLGRFDDYSFVEINPTSYFKPLTLRLETTLTSSSYLEVAKTLIGCYQLPVGTLILDDLMKCFIEKSDKGPFIDEERIQQAVKIDLPRLMCLFNNHRALTISDLTPPLKKIIFLLTSLLKRKTKKKYN